MPDYFIIYKPFQVLTAFGEHAGKKTLKDFFDVPTDVYPVGRLDFDSEGLLLLTNDTSLNHRLLAPEYGHEREYWVQVEGTVSDDALNKLRDGVTLSLDGKPYKTKPAKASRLGTEMIIPERNPPIRFRQHIPDSWIRLLLTEGKNRQVRKMTAATGFPTLRLIRYRMAGLSIEGLQPGDMRIMPQSQCYKALGLPTPG